MQKYVSLHLTTLRSKKVEVTGNDLKALGVEPGPRYAAILRRVLAAVIDGQAVCRAEQLALAGRLASGASVLAPLDRSAQETTCACAVPPAASPPDQPEPEGPRLDNPQAKA